MINNKIKNISNNKSINLIYKSIINTKNTKKYNSNVQI